MKEKKQSAILVFTITYKVLLFMEEKLYIKYYVQVSFRDRLGAFRNGKADDANGASLAVLGNSGRNPPVRLRDRFEGNKNVPARDRILIPRR